MCTFGFTPRLAYGLYTCENVDNYGLPQVYVRSLSSNTVIQLF